MRPDSAQATYRPSVVSTHATRGADAVAAVRSPVPRCRRFIDHQRRIPFDPACASLLSAEPAVGRQRLSADLRGVCCCSAADWLTCWGDGGSSSPAWSCSAHARSRRACRAAKGMLDRRSIAPGRRGRDDGAGGAVDPDDDIPGGRRSQHCARCLGCDQWSRRRRRRVPRRRLGRRAGMAVGVLRQHPGVPPGDKRRAAPALRRATARTTRPSSTPRARSWPPAGCCYSSTV